MRETTDVRISRELFDFLLGAGPLDGCWFGDRNPPAPGAFWWRKELSKCAAPEPAPKPAGGEPDGYQHRFRPLPDGQWVGWLDGPAPQLRGKSYEVEQRALFAAPTPPAVQTGLVTGAYPLPAPSSPRWRARPMSEQAFAWAAIAPDWASPPNFIHEGSVRRSRKEVQRFIAEIWAQDPRRGWKIAYRRGWRCKRVVIRLAFEKAS